MKTENESPKCNVCWGLNDQPDQPACQTCMILWPGALIESLGTRNGSESGITLTTKDGKDFYFNKAVIEGDWLTVRILIHGSEYSEVSIRHNEIVRFSFHKPAPSK